MIYKHIVYLLLSLFLFSHILLAKEAVISGNAVYAGNEVLPANAKFEILLEDISLQDTFAECIGETSIDPAGQIPIAFEIKFDDAKIKLGHRYAIRAKITTEDILLYVSDTVSSVFTGNNDKNIHLDMKRVGKLPESRVMEGMYKYMSDAAMFKECITGKYYPVVFEEDSIALEKAYLNEVNGSNFFVKVELKGKIVKRPNMEGKSENSLLVEHFIKVVGLKDCTELHSNVPIVNNYWKLSTLYGKKIKSKSNQREAHILLKNGFNGAGELKVFSGCNMIIGNYKIDEKMIKFRAQTLEKLNESCKDKALERNFMSALDNALYWSIEGERLKIFDETDHTLAVFQAIYF